MDPVIQNLEYWVFKLKATNHRDESEAAMKDGEVMLARRLAREAVDCDRVADEIAERVISAARSLDGA